MPTTAQRVYSDRGIEPLFGGEAKCLPGVMPASTTLVQGTVVGEFTPRSDVQTITPPGSGTFIVTVTTAAGLTYSTAALAWNISNALFTAALVALTPIGAGNVVVTGTPGTNAILTFGGTLANQLIPILAVSAGSIAHTTPGINPGTYGAYASGHSDGTQVPKGIWEYNSISDASAAITLGDQTGGGDFGVTYQTVPLFVSGTFKTEDLTGLDANAVTIMGRLLEGTTVTGIVRFG